LALSTPDMVEVLIAGAGPAGCVAGTMLARAGVRVLLVDRARFPRDKLCGDTLNPGAMKDLRRLDLAGPATTRGLPIHGMVLTDGSGVRVDGRYPAGSEGRAIRRREFDQGLLDAALRAGARFQDSVSARAPLVEHDRRGSRVRGAVLRTREGRDLRLPALVTIGADGRHSTLAFSLGLARHPSVPRRWAIGAYFEGVAGLDRVGEMHVRANHYLGVAPLPDGLANACLVTCPHPGFRSPLSFLKSTLASDPLLAERFASSRPVGPAGVVGPLAVESIRPGMAGLLLAGDAAGFIDPMTGDGLRFAIRGGEFAARAALDMLEHGWTDAHTELARWRSTEFGRKWRFNRALRFLVGSEARVRMAAACARVMPGLFRTAIAVAGDA
jgi:flavin-dependent dehydrogenase